MADTFKDNVAIITGASSGIGRDMALQMAAQGAKLVLAARRADLLEQVAAECRAAGGEALAVPTDVSEQAQCEALIRRSAEHYGRIDTLINDAGTSMWSRVDALQDLSVIERVMRVNYLGSVWCTYYALPALEASRGRIGVVNSLAGKTGVPERSGYSASKHALTGFFDTLRIELVGSGVSVTMVFPAFVASGYHARIPGPDGQPLGDEQPVDYGHAMPTATCARITLRALARRRREVIMTPRGKLGMWIKVIAPGLVDTMARRAVSSGR